MEGGDRVKAVGDQVGRIFSLENKGRRMRRE